jgi:hypothetical protein
MIQIGKEKVKLSLFEDVWFYILKILKTQKTLRSVKHFQQNSRIPNQNTKIGSFYIQPQQIHWDRNKENNAILHSKKKKK